MGDSMKRQRKLDFNPWPPASCRLPSRAELERIHQQASEAAVVANATGELLTVQEMAGFQLCIGRMDDEMLGYWNAPCDTPYFKK